MNSEPTNTAKPSDCKNCKDANYDVRCEHPESDPEGGLGCNACGHQECRICGVTRDEIKYPACITSTSEY